MASGVLHTEPGQPLRLRLLLDGSALEVFTSGWLPGLIAYMPAFLGVCWHSEAAGVQHWFYCLPSGHTCLLETARRSGEGACRAGWCGQTCTELCSTSSDAPARCPAAQAPARP